MKDCVSALAIPPEKECVRESSPTPVSPAVVDDSTDGDTQNNATDLLQEDEDGDAGNITVIDEAEAAENVDVRIERTYEIEAEVDLFYDDGNVEFEFHGELVIGQQCEVYQLLADAELKVRKPALNATGDVMVTCPDDSGGRNFSLNVTLWEWQITDGIKVVDASLQLNATKHGGVEGFGSGVSLVGALTGGVVIDQNAIPSAAAGNFEFEIFLMVEIEFSKKACPVKEDPVAIEEEIADAESPEPSPEAEAPESSPVRRRKLLQSEEEAAEEEECGFSLDSVSVEAEFSVQ
jgi:hypothetical protein